MDQAYNAHQDRRRNRSSTNLQHLSLAPLTTRLPINDADMINPELSVQTTSYIQGKSAPTTPSLLARSPSRRRQGTMTPHGAASPKLPKSKSATHLSTTTTTNSSSRPKSGTTTPGGHRRGSRREQWEELQLSAIPRAPADRDWLLRAGVVISSETRESKGQSWLVSRASSTSLGRSADGTDEDEDAGPDLFERERIARENAIASRHASRRGSLGLVFDDEEVFGSRAGSRSRAVTPGERAMSDGYFADHTLGGEEEYMAGPDFVNLNEKLELEALGMDLDTTQDDEAAVRRLVTRGHGRPHTWFGNIMGWTLFSVQERDEEDNEGGDGEVTDVEAEDTLSDTSAAPEFEGMTALSRHERHLSPPRADDGSWQDAAWLLSVASKVAWS